MKWDEIVRDYFTFTRRDRIGVVAILTILIVVFLLPEFVPGSRSKPIATDTLWMVAMKRLEVIEAEDRSDNDNSRNYQYDRPTTSSYAKRKGELFYFDPNTLSTEDWQRLGLRDKTISTIQNYLSKGGHFRKPEDLQKVYGLFPNEYARIAPYIKIESTGTNNYKDLTEKTANKDQPAKTYAPRYTVIDINLSDTTAFIALPGIGSKLAARIVNFREKLGGFYSIAQVGETFGLPDSTFQKIKQYLKLENTSIRKININTATVDELKTHPYIKWSIANPIVAYRNEHGPFTKVDDLKKIMVITDDIYNKIAPYLAVQ